MESTNMVYGIFGVEDMDTVDGKNDSENDPKSKGGGSRTR